MAHFSFCAGFLFEQVASNGVVVVLVDSDESGGQPLEDYPEQLDATLDFVFNTGENGLLASLREQEFIGEIDTSKIMVGGHGVGARIMLERLSLSECEDGAVAGVVLLEPVEKPPIEFGLNEEPNIIPDDSENIPWITPALIMATGLSNEKTLTSIGPCAPEETSNLRFYNKWRGPVFFANAVDFGHLDLLEFGVQYSELGQCVSTSRSRNEKICYRQAVAAHITHFMNKVFFDDPVSDAFINPDVPPDVEETINAVAFKREFAVIELRPDNTFEVVDGQCTFDPEALDQLTRTVLIGVGVFGIFVLLTIGFLFFTASRRSRKEEDRLEKLAEEMQGQSVVPGMGFHSDAFPTRGRPAPRTSRPVSSQFPGSIGEDLDQIPASGASVASSMDDFPSLPRNPFLSAAKDGESVFPESEVGTPREGRKSGKYKPGTKHVSGKWISILGEPENSQNRTSGQAAPLQQVAIPPQVNTAKKGPEGAGAKPNDQDDIAGYLDEQSAVQKQGKKEFLDF